MRILVVGGTGGFGGTICRMLRDDRHLVAAAGRDEARGAAFAQDNPGIGFVRLDRDAVTHADLAGYDIVVDAAGPFRGQNRSLAQACVRAGCHHLDIADDRTFVTGVTDLDADARREGVVVLSGASSIPALSCAAAAELAEGMDQVLLVEIAITASSKAAFGRSVLHSMLSGAGRRIDRSDGTTGWGMTDPRHLIIARPGTTPLRRTVLEVDGPDQDVVADLLAGRPSVRFRAGGELRLHNLAMRLVAQAVKTGILDDGARMLAFAGLARRLTSWIGSGESGMEVSVVGDVAGRRTRRTWQLLARRGSGPRVPCLVVPALVELIAKGGISPGARPAVGILGTGDVLVRMPAHHASTRIRTIDAPPVHSRMHGWDRLAPAIRTMHDFPRHPLAAGSAQVVRGTGLLARLVAWTFGFPDAGVDVPVTVRFSPEGNAERWTRTFGERIFSSVISASGSGLRERFGPFSFRFRLEERNGTLTMVPRSWRLLGVRLPRGLMPDGVATEREVDGIFHFDVPIRAPFVGMIVHYRGWLIPQTTH